MDPWRTAFIFRGTSSEPECAQCSAEPQKGAWRNVTGTQLLIHLRQESLSARIPRAGASPLTLCLTLPDGEQAKKWCWWKEEAILKSCSATPLLDIKVFYYILAKYIYNIKFTILMICECIVQWRYTCSQYCVVIVPYIYRTFSSPQTKTLYPLNASSPPPSSPGKPTILPSVSEFDYSRHTTLSVIENIGLFVAGLFYLA
jgi:hypothetical protein